MAEYLKISGTPTVNVQTSHYTPQYFGYGAYSLKYSAQMTRPIRKGLIDGIGIIRIVIW